MIPYELLPTERDFDPLSGDADAQRAWEHFGGLTLDEAHAKFRKNPLYYQEDFMFMGGKAFAYYFPVLERHLTTVPDSNSDGEDHESWILAHCIKMQFCSKTAHHVLHLKQRVFALSAFVLQNIRRFSFDTDGQRRVAAAWAELETHLATVTQE